MKRIVLAAVAALLLAGCADSSGSGGGGSSATSTPDNGSAGAAKYAFKDVAHKLADKRFLNYRLQDTACHRSGSRAYVYDCTATIMAEDGPHGVSGRVNWRKGTEQAQWDD